MCVIAEYTVAMRFYLVRHGETASNLQHIRQGAGGALSENGRQQAERVGRALELARVKRIISSSYPRAQETAMIINSHLHVPILYSSLLVERRNPKEVIGRSTRDPEVARIIDQTELSYHADDYRFSDEENFMDLKHRAQKCLALLSSQGVHETCVVTHHVFLKILLSYMLFRDQLHASDFAKLSFFNYADNAGITTCEYSPWRMFSKTRGWKILGYNERPPQ